MDAKIRPEALLAAEMIIITLNDCRSKDKHLRNEALAWFDMREQSPFGYGWCLSLTHANPNMIRGLIGKRIQGKMCMLEH
jgi:hypothetical protein